MTENVITRAATVDEVVAWLHDLPVPMIEHESAFREHDVDGEKLCSTPLRELQDMLGITKLGHKHILKRLVANMSGTAEPVKTVTVPSHVSATATQHPTTSAKPALEAKKRSTHALPVSQGSDADQPPDKSAKAPPKPVVSITEEATQVMSIDSPHGSTIFLNPEAGESLLMMVRHTPLSCICYVISSHV